MRRPAKYLLIILVIVALITMSGCGSIANKLANAAKDKVSEQMNDDENSDENDNEDSEDTTDENTDENTDETDAEDNQDSTAITTSDSKDMGWPEENMGNMPKIDDKITGVWTADATCTVSFEGMDRKTADDYVASLKDLGYKDGYEGEEDDVLTFMKTDKDGNYAWFTYNADGTGGLIYTEASSS
jgi:hypothetical protein